MTKNTNHFEVIHYFLASGENDLDRLIDYVNKYEIKHLLGENETRLVEDLSKAYIRYAEQERRTNAVLQTKEPS